MGMWNVHCQWDAHYKWDMHCQWDVRCRWVCALPVGCVLLAAPAPALTPTFSWTQLRHLQSFSLQPTPGLCLSFRSWFPDSIELWDSSHQGHYQSEMPLQAGISGKIGGGGGSFRDSTRVQKLAIGPSPWCVSLAS